MAEAAVQDVRLFGQTPTHRRPAHQVPFFRRSRPGRRTTAPSGPRSAFPRRQFRRLCDTYVRGPGSFSALPSGSIHDWGRPTPHPPLSRLGRHLPTNTLGKSHRRPAHRGSACRNRGKEQVLRPTYRSLVDRLDRPKLVMQPVECCVVDRLEGGGDPVGIGEGHVVEGGQTLLGEPDHEAAAVGRVGDPLD